MSEREELILGLDALNARVCGAQREFLRQIARAEDADAWADSGARDMAHWLTMRYGISYWKAGRWIAAGHALEGLPRIADALSSGELSLDKVVELCRFATAETEDRLIDWARTVSCGAIRHRGDLAMLRPIEQAHEVERARSLTSWFFDEGRRYGMYLEAPAVDGAVLDRAVTRAMSGLPIRPGEDATGTLPPDGQMPWWPWRRLDWPPMPMPTGPPWWSMPRWRLCRGRRRPRSRAAGCCIRRPLGGCCAPPGSRSWWRMPRATRWHSVG